MKKASSRGRLVVLLVASLSLSLGMARAGGRAETGLLEAPRLLVVWYDGHRLYPGTHGGVAREIASIFPPLELEMRWLESIEYDERLDERSILLRIVLTPSDPSGPGWGLDGDVLGAAPPGNGRVRSIYIFYHKLKRAVARNTPNPPVRLLEKALARVVAHEMIHAVAPSVRHAKRGLMRPSVGSSFLAGHNVVASSPVRQAFLAGAESILATASP